LQAGLTENLVFKHLHQDAEHLYNTTMSLHAVVTQLIDRSKRLPRKVRRGSLPNHMPCGRCHAAGAMFNYLRWRLTPCKVRATSADRQGQ